VNLISLSGTNSKVKRLRRFVSEKSVRVASGISVVEGEKLILELLEPRNLSVIKDIDTREVSLIEIYLDSTQPRLIERFENLVSTDKNVCQNINIFKISPKVLNNISALKNSPGSLALVKTPSPIDLDQLNFNQDIVILADINDPNNLGPIVRSSLAFGISQIVLTGNSCEMYSPKVIRSSVGAVLRCKNVHHESLTSALSIFKKNGYYLLGTSVKNGEELKNLKYTSPTAIVLGSESRGIDSKFMTLFDGVLKIRTEPTVESLNLSVAAGIILRDIYAAKR
jgi:TrmH family RNA methyltransferase